MSGPSYPAYYDPRPRLDRLMSRMRAHDDAPWGWRPAVLPIVALAVLIALGNLATHLLHPHSLAAALTATIVLTGVLYGVRIAVVYVVHALFNALALLAVILLNN